MKKQPLLLIVAAISVMAGASAASAGIIAQFDAFNSAGTWYEQPFYTNYYIAQTFTTTAAGMVNSVDMPLSSVAANNPDHLPLNVSIQPLGPDTINGRQPTGTILSSGSIAYNDPQFSGFSLIWINIPLTPATQLAAGQTYALVATVGSPGDTYPNQAYNWFSKSEKDVHNNPVDLYPGGQLAVNSSDVYAQQPNQDVAFRINALPEPTGLAVLCVGAAGLLLKRRRGQV